MTTHKKKLHAEKRLLSKFRAFRLSRILLMLILCPLFIFHFPTAFYVLLALCALPPLYRRHLQNVHPDIDREKQACALLAQEMTAAHFSYTGYRAERFGVVLAFLLLALWQWIQPMEYWYDFPVWLIPSMLFACYYILQTFLFFFFCISR